MTVRAILIDSVRREVRSVDYSGRFRGPGGAYELVSQPGTPEVSMLEPVAYLGDGQTLFVDEEATLKENTCSFWFKGVFVKLLGCGIILAEDYDGMPIDTTLTISDVWGRVVFPDAT